MTLTITHAKTVTIPDPTQADLDEQIALGNYPPGTLLADISLQSDWNDDHVIVGSLPASSVEVTQVAHGFSVGQLVYLVGSTYTLAMADDAVSAEVVGMVSAVADADDFTLTTGGLVSGLSGLAAGTVYFLSPSVAGALTATEPTTNGQVSKPVFVANSATSGFLINYRGEVIGGSAPVSSTNSAQVTLGFGATEQNLTSVTVSADWVTTASILTASVAYESTADHTPDEAMAEGLIVSCGNIVDGVSFDLIAFAPNCTWGEYKFNVIGV